MITITDQILIKNKNKNNLFDNISSQIKLTFQ
jgi:hypothetical protein